MRRVKRAGEPRWLREGRKLILEEAEPMYHALGCDACGLRNEAILILALYGWTEADFVTAEMEGRAGV